MVLMIKTKGSYGAPVNRREQGPWSPLWESHGPAAGAAGVGPRRGVGVPGWHRSWSSVPGAEKEDAFSGPEELGEGLPPFQME